VELRYGLLKKAIVERQVIKGGVIDQKAEWIRGLDAFDMEEFKRLWSNHMTNNIPGFDEEGVVRGLTKNKEDVVEKICKTYLEGMEWAMKYYTNRHSYFDQKTGLRKSVLDTKWYYPYFHAPLISQLRDQLWKFIMADSRRLFVLSPKTNDVQLSLKILFSGKGDVTPRTSGLMKLEKDMLEVLPANYLKNKDSQLTKDVTDQLDRLIAEHRKALEMKINGRSFENQYGYVMKRLTTDAKYVYRGENVFSDRWTAPRTLYGASEDTLLIAPSSTNYKVQLMAVLPQQSHKLFPDGILPSEPHISWMFPSGIPVDFTFRDRVHAAILLIPPPNIEVLENHLKFSKVQQAVEQIRTGMFPPGVDSPAINPTALKRVSYYDSFRNVFEDEVSRVVPSTMEIAIDVFGGVGISACALSRNVNKVLTFEPNRENIQDLKTNIDQLPRGSQFGKIVPKQSYFNPTTDFDPETGLVCMDLTYEMKGGADKSRDIRVQMSKENREGTPLESVIEEIIEQFKSRGKKTKMSILIKLPQYRSMKKIVTDLKVRTKFIKDTVNDIQFVYALITVEKAGGDETSRDFYGYGGGDFGYGRGDRDDYYGRDLDRDRDSYYEQDRRGVTSGYESSRRERY